MQFVVINEQHSLLEDQLTLLTPGYQMVKVPADGWDYATQLQVVEGLLMEMRATLGRDWEDPHSIVFVSPIPAMLKLLAVASGLSRNTSTPFDVLVFHNDRREKKELPGGKIISVTASTGWQLV